MAPNDEHLIRRMSVDPEAFESFYRRHIDRVTRVASRRCESPSDVADVVSATFLSALSSCSSFDPKRGSAGAWVLGIAANEAAAVRRRSSHQAKIVDRLIGHDLLDEFDELRLSERIDAERIAPAVRQALDAGPPTEKELFLLVAHDGLTPAEAARALGISSVAARVRLSRARRRLAHFATASTPSTPPRIPEAQK